MCLKMPKEMIDYLYLKLYTSHIKATFCVSHHLYWYVDANSTARKCYQSVVKVEDFDQLLKDATVIVCKILNVKFNRKILYNSIMDMKLENLDKFLY